MTHLLTTAAVLLDDTVSGTKPSMNPEVIIIGAGIAGASLAAALGRAGKKVLVIERNPTEPDRIVGELLQPGGVQKLRALGIEGCLEGIDSPAIEGYAVFKSRTESVHLHYPEDTTTGKEARGRSFHHGRFVMRLRQAAAASPNVTIIHGVASTLIENESKGIVEGVEVQVGMGELSAAFFDKPPHSVPEARGPRVRYYAPLTIVCDGCTSNLRKQVIARKTETKSHFVGMVMSQQTVGKDFLPYPHCGHVVLADPAPVLLYPISSTEVRVLVDMPTTYKMSQLQFMREITYPQLPAALQAPFKQQLDAAEAQQQNPSLLETQRKVIMSMPNTYLHPDPFTMHGVLAIGDTLNMRHPLTGGGMTVALNDAVHVRDAVVSVGSLHQPENQKILQNKLKGFYVKRYPLAATINVLSLALYAVFAATDDPYLPEMREACFKYFELGGECCNGPMSMLAGLSANPLKLIFHFFAVAVYSMYRMTLCKGIPTPFTFYRAWRVFWAACRIITPLLYKERVIAPWHFAPRQPKKLLYKPTSASAPSPASSSAPSLAPPPEGAAAAAPSPTVSPAPIHMS